jgi:hypothetical protein
MPSRARDSKVLWFGEVKHSLGSNTAAVEVKKVLKVETREISLGPAEHVELSGSSRNLFPGGLSAGEEVIVTGSNDCPVLPSTERNVAMLNKWLDTYRPLWSDSLPDGPSLPQVRIPEGLR